MIKEYTAPHYAINYLQFIGESLECFNNDIFLPDNVGNI